MANKHLLISFFFSICLLSSAQVKFKAGYIINNRHERTPCLIRNIGNEESTMTFEYKLNNSKNIQKIELSKIEEFGIEDELKCIRALISIDMSRDRIKNIKDTLSQWEEGHAFLNVLVEGKSASLYSYHDYGTPLFFSDTNVRVYGKNKTPLAVVLGCLVWPCIFIPGTKAQMPQEYEVEAMVSSNTEYSF